MVHELGEEQKIPENEDASESEIVGSVPLTIYMNGQREVVGVADVLQDGTVHAAIFPDLSVVSRVIANEIRHGRGGQFSLDIHAAPIMPRRVPSTNASPVTNEVELTAWVEQAYEPPKEQ